ncbi:MAG: hypothetical protein HY460_02500 [Parcubacteria group bacterium]|nr:hypothetical protein [Parcubacteria group bacterium]
MTSPCVLSLSLTPTEAELLDLVVAHGVLGTSREVVIATLLARELPRRAVGDLEEDRHCSAGVEHPGYLAD